MRALLLAAATALLAATAPPALAAQTLPPLRVSGVGEPVTVSTAMHRGYPAYPAWALRALGARVDATGGGTRIILEGDTLEFEAGSPFFRTRGKAWQMIEPAYREGGIFYLPHQLFVEWIPATYAGRVAYGDGALRLTGVAVGGDATGGGAPPARAQGDTAGGQRPAGETAAGRRAAGDTDRPEPLGRPTGAPLIVIDPGHGGPDPGRTGPSGLREKDIVLQVSKRLARVLADRGYDVRMTRTTDTLIPLDDRPHMANEWRGNRPALFLSIHANGVSDRRVRGFETFFLSDARTEDERRVAEMENAAVAYEEPGRRGVADDDLGAILNGLRNDFYIRASNTLAGYVQKEFGTFHSGTNRGVKQAGFRVLIGAFMPAVLIELAFISNPAEERLLGSGRFQVDAATAIANAVDHFFESHEQVWTGANR